MDWAQRYAEKNTPWDNGEAHPDLRERFADLDLPRGGRALVPGCGRGHDALFLAQQGLNVLAVDLVEGLADEVGARFEKLGSRFLVADALTLEIDEPFDLVFEQTFYCAIDPEQRPAWAALQARALKPGGKLAVLVFPIDRPKDLGGPPWQTRSEDLQAVLGENFRLLVEEPARHPLEKREWREGWSVFERVEGSASC
ncbi:MAG: methyltransferase domain-containing protein [Planctomycetota bacterium]